MSPTQMTSAGNATIVTTAGQVGSDINGNVPEDPELQIRLAFRNLSRCLEAAGASTDDILKLTYYIVNYDPSNRRHRAPLLEFLGSSRPASTLIPVPALAEPQYLFEIEAVAAIPWNPLRDVDVVVVGAGLSGLQAAYDLQKAGLTCTVLEARERVGGKTLSRNASGGIVDVGAAWINDTNQSRMFELAKHFKLEVLVQNTNGNIAIEDSIGRKGCHLYGEVLQHPEFKTAIEDMVRIRDLVEETCQKLDITDPIGSAKSLGKDMDAMTLEQWIRSEGGGQYSLDTATVWTRAMLGLEPSEVSALYFLDYCKSGGGLMQMRSDRKDGGQYLRIRQGTQSFSKGLAGLLSPDTLMLKSPVRKIRQVDNGAIVTSARGEYRCRKVIVSVPTPLYKEIIFEPELPDSKIKLSSGTKLGSYCKAIACYKTPWWRKYNMCGLAQSPVGPFAVTRDTSDDAVGHFSLTCFIVGQPAREWAKLSPDGRRTAVIDQVARAYGPFAKPEDPVDVVEQIWAEEQWSQGCPCPAMPPGVMTELFDALRAPFGKIHFVGTETAYEWKGYMEGAVRSGERGAQEVLQSLSKSKL
ncbi:putative flavin-containing amine [Phaeomoniella chlamydospora]|uniref:Amine oxidase n=1 Tax=Phaeomoniella chlamydospora TaxID=158046 RepID=A0A0G2GNI3_PHACM|nr:putative flavin-containing amine [Phaeomoniella chlamydospora]